MWKRKKQTEVTPKEQGSVRKKGNGMKGKKAVPALVLAAAVIGVLAFLQHSNQAKAAQAKAGAVRTGVATVGRIASELSSSGVVSPKNTYSITSLVEGEVIAADFEEGDQVTEGQVLYQIDVSSMESELKSANTSLERANNKYADALEDYKEAVSDYSGNTYKSTRTGFIKSLSVQAGDKINPGTQLAEVYNDQTMKLKVPFLSGEAAGISAGSQAAVTLTDTGEQLTGVVTAVSNMDEVLEGGRLVRSVTLEVNNPGGLTVSHNASVQIGEVFSAGEGNFEPVTDTVMTAEVLGNGSLKIERLLVHEGDYVTVGTPLFQIDSQDVEDVLSSFKDQVDSAQETLDSAQSRLDSAQETYENYTITAPISGQVITKSVKAGDTVSRNANSETTLAVIYDLSELTFEMSVDELDVRSVKVGQKVTVTADALENQTFTGTVTNVSLQSTQSNGVTNYPVTVTLDESGDLLPGMNVDGVILLDEVEDALLVPVDALMRGNQVYVKDDSVTEASGNVPAGFRAVDVETGISSENYVQILSGLTEGQEVYVDESSKDTEAMFPMGGMPGGNMPGGGAPGGGRTGGGPGGIH